MPGLVPGIHVLNPRGWAWIAGTSPAMTPCRARGQVKMQGYCFCSFVSVPVPLLSVAEYVTLSPAWTASSIAASLALYS
jgi:hypothetical protein